ncbi:GNAT family N-acetyltransferase [Asticcacaulis machinosus]|uniref:N-acetyltransferase n=1 Tax=Asticcacaulis machinosus TaxID=2984211 RepID=A0ABT5HE81_9CAUL|nr:N-acetyltransferase [Asticcacaulis machinosus]MDC7674564.1 N-acetyltransferase [Asticcacaulis machinosus]
MDAYLYSDTTNALVVMPEAAHQESAINNLIYKVFGPGRYVKTAERLREGNHPCPDLSLVAMKGETLMGSVRLWPVVVKSDDGDTVTEVAFLGPITVDPAVQGGGIGSQLVEAALDKAFAKGLSAVLLVGDFDYFKRFGFERAQVSLPGPADPKRILIAYAQGAAPLTGKVSVRR